MDLTTTRPWKLKSRNEVIEDRKEVKTISGESEILSVAWLQFEGGDVASFVTIHVECFTKDHTCSCHFLADDMDEHLWCSEQVSCK